MLIFSNLLTIFFAVKENWNFLLVLWIYWFQSIIIGIFNFIRILNLKEFSTENFYINDKPVAPTEKTKIETAFFFLLHYGTFHLVYMSFLLGDQLPKKYKLASTDWKYIFFISVIFFVNHCFSFIYNKERDKVKQNIGRLMFFPYARIFPMHFIILFGVFVGRSAIALFLFFKTIADVIMHVIEHSETKNYG